MTTVIHNLATTSDLYTIAVSGVSLVTLVLVNRVLVARLERRGDSE